MNHYYLYLFDPDWGPAFIKTDANAPWPIWIYLNGHEWAKRQLEIAGIGYEALDNGLRSCEDPVTARPTFEQATTGGEGQPEFENRHFDDRGRRVNRASRMNRDARRFTGFAGAHPERVQGCIGQDTGNRYCSLWAAELSPCRKHWKEHIPLNREYGWGFSPSKWAVWC